MPLAFRSRRLLLLAGAALVVPACDDAQPGVPLAEQLAEAFCAHQFACCAPIELSALTSDRYTTQAACVSFAALAAREQLAAVDGAVARGRITIDPAGAAACVAAYRDRACRTSPQSPQAIGALPDVAEVLALCPELLVGHVPAGAACDLSPECMPGSRCVGVTSSVVSGGGTTGVPTGAGAAGGGGPAVSLGRNPGICVRYQTLGQPCNDSSDCDPGAGLVCRSPGFVCGPRLTEGEACALQFDPLTGQASDACDGARHLYCDTGALVCRPYPQAGEPCAAPFFPQCDPDPALALSCIPFGNTCKKPGDEGDPCGGPAIPPCRADLACRSTQSDGIGTCGIPPATGERCSDRCASPAVCVGGICTLPGAAPLGAACTLFTDCASLTCGSFTSPTPVSAVCSPPNVAPVCAGAGISPSLPVNVSGTGGIGGTVGTGAAGSTTVGAGGAGGTGGTAGVGGAGGGGGGGPPLGCEAIGPAVGDPLIADFTMDGAAMLPIGGTFTYGGAAAPTATVSDGAWHLTAQTTGTDGPQYIGAGIFFLGSPPGLGCVDASFHGGVQFDISGVVDGTGCAAQYATNDSAHMWSGNDPRGIGDVGAYAPQAPLTVTATPVTVMMPFRGTGAPVAGSPAIPVDPTELLGVQWQFTTAAGTENSCHVDVTIDNVRFF
ncbi:MAG TPA: hypothetical protein VIF57_31075 [Polyangia bacterium]|jgi:hypothetical protein